MEDVNRPSVGQQKLYFPRIQQKIQKKYDEMQKKIEKSRSMDLLTEECDTNNSSRNIDPDNKSSEHEDRQNVIETDLSEKYAITIEEVKINDNNIVYQNVDLSKSSDFKQKHVRKDTEQLEIQNPNSDINFLKLSTESLNGISKKNGDHTDTPSPSPKISFRDRFRKKRQETKEKRSPKKESREKVEKFIFSNTKRTKVATVTIALIEVSGLPVENTEDKLHAFSFRFSLGAEKQKSKQVKSNVSTAKFQELFNMNLYEEHYLRVSFLDRDEVVGRSVIDLSELEKEKTHRMRIALDGEKTGAQMFILLTMSGTSLSVLNINDCENTHARLKSEKHEFAWYRLHNNMSEVGILTGIVYGAKGLAGQDFYCVLQLGNERLQTPTEYKTNDPNWMKAFKFQVSDITQILGVLIYDEKRSEEVGRISIPLLKIENGVRKWYMLKNIQREVAKGNNPMIWLEMTVSWNIVKAAARVITPIEENYLRTENRFNRQIFANNLSRAKVVFNWVKDTTKAIKSLFEWESKLQNIIALAIWIVSCLLFKVWMFPLLLLIPFFKYVRESGITETLFYFNKEGIDTDRNLNNNEVVDDESKIEKEEKSSILKKLNNLQEMVQSVQNLIGDVASLGERFKNLFNFTVPFLSYLTIFIVFLLSFVMFLVPFNYILILWGIHKFARKILRPNRIPNNEILDLLSRVPDDETLLDCEELPLQMSEDDNL